MSRVAEVARALAWLVLCAFVVGGIALLLVGATGCTPRTAQATATVATESAAVAGSVGVRLLAEEENRAGLRAVEASTSLDDARARLAAIEARFEPAWSALDALQVAQDVAADALEAGELPDVVALGRVLCAAAMATDALGIELPGTEACR